MLNTHFETTVLHLNPGQCWITHLKPLQAKQATKHINFSNWTEHSSQFNINQAFTRWEEININLSF